MVYSAISPENQQMLTRNQEKNTKHQGNIFIYIEIGGFKMKLQHWNSKYRTFQKYFLQQVQLLASEPLNVKHE